MLKEEFIFVVNDYYNFFEQIMLCDDFLLKSTIHRSPRKFIISKTLNKLMQNTTKRVSFTIKLCMFF